MLVATYSPGILPYIPFFYVIWSDDLLSASEIQVVQTAVTEDTSLSADEQRQLLGWLDKSHPPENAEIKSWQQLISKSGVALIESETHPLEAFSLKVAQFYNGRDQHNTQLQKIERNLGIQPNHYNHLFHVEVVHQPYATTYSGTSLDVVLNKTGWNTILEFRKFLEQDTFTWAVQREKSTFREQVLDQLQLLAKHGWGAYAYPSANGGMENLETYASIFEHLVYVDGSLAVKFGVQFGLFGGSIQNLGNAMQRKQYLTAAGKATLLGCFAMTETGHGSNVRGIKTTATYLPEERCLVIHTPGKDDNKEYIGNALHATMATVFAQLLVNGKNEGVHAILVPLRNARHQVYDGITIEDNGYKLGLNGVDNGKIWFNQVKVPVENLLDHYGGIDATGSYHSKIKNPNKRFFTML
ncbi:MAG: acyl-CoA dehydrogenase family protein, partial [Bacteroidota bacterium]